MSACDSDVSLATRARRILETAPETALPMTYQQLAEALGLQPPRTIQRVAQALETLMREDAARGRPFIATLVISRREPRPAQGFFDLAVELGRFPSDPAQQINAYHTEYHRALRAR
ncbi:hypothetical protein [Aidingimonas halophila]|uniref:Uncharacterized protein n=1 Tax=Aidingimonas halophila TaxID=574349 RepID=A0A1H3FFW9_9GAMM|nr:hypothetical protein [Aidingimonas halophila]GHC37962.1 hypothetical protein GCM10008094_34140 [Aidingimonas halophila]SDX89840.1 hypothetical protein SAMN05443545_10814 [Aidingimonas halophila]